MKCFKLSYYTWVNSGFLEIQDSLAPQLEVVSRHNSCSSRFDRLLLSCVLCWHNVLTITCRSYVKTLIITKQGF